MMLCVRYVIKRVATFSRKKKCLIVYGKNAETKQQVRHMRQARLRAAELQRQNPLVSLYLFFLTGAGAVFMYFLSFLSHSTKRNIS